MSTTQIAALVITSGLAAGLVSGLVTLLSGRSERAHRTAERAALERHEARLRKESELHEALLRREAAHDAARAIYLPIAEQFQTWAERIAHEAHWRDAGEFAYASSSRPMPASDEEAIDCLRSIKFGHPTKQVRNGARSLCADIEHQWTDVTAAGVTEPTLDEANDWLRRADALIEQIHSHEE